MRALSACPLSVLGRHHSYASPRCLHKTRTRPLHSTYTQPSLLLAL